MKSYDYDQGQGPSSRRRPFDLDSESETINLIKTQNQKIQELYSELERKEGLINNYQHQIASFEPLKYQNDNLKKQNTILEDKIKLYEQEFNNQSAVLSEAMKKSSETEGRLRNHLKNKERIITDMENLIKDHDNQISSLKYQLNVKEKNEKDLSHEFKNLADKTSILSKNHSTLIENNDQLKEEYEGVTKQFKEEKGKFEKKVKELIEIIEQQSKELLDYEKEYEKLERENSMLKNKLENYKSQFEEINRQIPEFQKNFEFLNEDRGKMENLSNKLERLWNEEKIKNQNYVEDKEKLTKICEELERKLKENEERIKVMNNQQIILKRDLSDTRETNENLNKNINILERRASESEIEIKELTTALNYELTTIIQWIETYFGVYFQKSLEISSLPRTQSQLIYSKVQKFEMLKDVLITARKVSDDEMRGFDKTLSEQRDEIEELTVKVNKYINDISGLKADLLNKSNEIYNLVKKYDNVTENYSLLEDENQKLNGKITGIVEKNNDFGNKITILAHKIFENFKSSAKYQKYAELINYQAFSETRSEEIVNDVEKLDEIVFSLLKDYEIASSKAEELSKIKAENEKLISEINIIRRVAKEEYDKVVKDKEISLESMENDKYEEVKRVEGIFKAQNDKLKQKLSEKEDEIKDLEHQNSLLKSQVNFLDTNITTSKQSLADTMQTMTNKYESINEKNKQLETDLNITKRELNLKTNEVSSLKTSLKNKNSDLEDLKIKLDYLSNLVEKNDEDNIRDDNEKLSKDNMALMNANYLLREQLDKLNVYIDQLKREENKTRNASSSAVTRCNHEEIMKENYEKLRLYEEELNIKDRNIRELRAQLKSLTNSSSPNPIPSSNQEEGRKRQQYYNPSVVYGETIRVENNQEYKV